MPTPTFPRDRFDEIPDSSQRSGAHRAENPRMRGWAVVLWALLATIVLVVVGILGTMIVAGRLSLFPGADPTATATAAPESVVDTGYSVLVLNATDATGLAASVRDVIVTAGWDPTKVYATDAGRRDFAETTVYYALPGDEAAARGLAGVVGGARVEQSSQYQPADGADAKQLTVVLGRDRTVAPAS